MNLQTSSRVRFARTTLSAALMAVSLALPAHAGLLGGGGGFGSVGGNLGGSIGPRGLDVAGNGSVQKQLQAPPVKDQATEAAQAGADKAKDGKTAAKNQAAQTTDKVGQRAQEGRANLTDRARGATETGLVATGNAAATVQKSPPAPAAEPATPSNQGTTPATTTQPSRQVQAGGSANASRSNGSVNAEASGSASVQR